MKRRASEHDQQDGPLNTASNAPVDEKRTLERALGHQIRALRRERDLSVSDLGAAAGISPGMISKMENGQISPSLGSINAVASALNVPITALFAAFEESRDCSYVKRGQGVVIERRGTKVGHIYELLGAGLRGEIVLEPYLITLKGDAESYTGFRHGGVEFIYMLTGEVSYRHADQDYHLKPGDSLMFDAQAMHGPAKLLKTPMTYLSIIAFPRP
ncbi:XRE family transcriptional regulator [Methylorubrum populi]|nr:XRE family transcriptional regulator [Methylorubrum populi]